MHHVINYMHALDKSNTSLFWMGFLFLISFDSQINHIISEHTSEK